MFSVEGLTTLCAPLLYLRTLELSFVVQPTLWLSASTKPAMLWP